MFIDLTGIVIVSVGGRALPSSINQFDQPRQCSMTTDSKHPAGVLGV